MTPVRTTVMTTLLTALDTITELKTVKRFEPVPTDLSTIPTPACFVYDSVAEQLQKNNLFMRVEAEMNIRVYISLTQKDASLGNVPFNDQADDIQAKIHAALHSQIPDATGIFEDIVDQSSEREVPNSDWGILTYTILVKYRHKFGDGFATGT